MRKTIIASLIVGSVLTLNTSCQKDDEGAKPSANNQPVKTYASGTSYVKIGSTIHNFTNAMAYKDSATLGKFVAFSENDSMSITLIFGSTAIPTSNQTYTITNNVSGGIAANEVYVSVYDYVELDDKEYLAESGSVSFQINNGNITISGTNIPTVTASDPAITKLDFSFQLK